MTHILGVRAFGTQLLCERVIGRALRRQSYELNDDGLEAAETCWVPGVNDLGSHGRWVFAEFTNVFDIAAEFEELVGRVAGVEPAA